MFTITTFVGGAILWMVGTAMLSPTSTEGRFIASLGMMCFVFAFVSLFG